MKFRVYEASPGVHVSCDLSLLLRQTDSTKKDRPGMTAVGKLLSFYLAFGLWEGMFTLYHVQHQVQSWHCPDDIEGSQVVLHEGSKYFNGWWYEGHFGNSPRSYSLWTSIQASLILTQSPVIFSCSFSSTILLNTQILTDKLFSRIDFWQQCEELCWSVSQWR